MYEEINGWWVSSLTDGLVATISNVSVGPALSLSSCHHDDSKTTLGFASGKEDQKETLKVGINLPWNCTDL